jgi:hypothetical protein
VKTEADIEVMWPQQGVQLPSEAKEARNGFSPKGAQPPQPLTPPFYLTGFQSNKTDVEFLASKTEAGYISVVLNHQACVSLSKP